MRACAVCRQHGGVIHHLLPVSVYPEYREEPMNHLPLCRWHHTMAGDICPHGMNRESRLAFNGWLKRNRPGNFRWMEEHSRKPIEVPAE